MSYVTVAAPLSRYSYSSSRTVGGGSGSRDQLAKNMFANILASVTGKGSAQSGGSDLVSRVSQKRRGSASALTTPTRDQFKTYKRNAPTRGLSSARSSGFGSTTPGRYTSSKSTFTSTFSSSRTPRSSSVPTSPRRTLSPSRVRIG